MNITFNIKNYHPLIAFLSEIQLVYRDQTDNHKNYWIQGLQPYVINKKESQPN